MSTADNWIMSGAAAAIFFAAISTGGNDDAQDAADDASDAVTAAQLRAAIDIEAQRLCAAEVGHGATVLWTHQGDLVCRPATQVAKGGAL